MATAIAPEITDGAAPDAGASALPDPREWPALAALLDSTHPVYRACVHDWLAAERRLFGGTPALSELQPLAGETAEDYAIRKRKATYIPFPKLFAAANAGHLARQAPTPDFGTLGAVRAREERTGEPSLAEQIFYNCDGIGADGTQWPAWWSRVTELVHAAGARWIYVESPELTRVRRGRARRGDGRTTGEDRRAGLRPYLLDWSLTQVPNWHVVDKRLEWAIVRVPTRDPKLEGDEFSGNDGRLGYLLLVRKGWQGFGPDFSAGGWWEFDHEKAPIRADAGWRRTRGEIPLFLFPYERSDGLTQPAGGSGVTITDVTSIGAVGEAAASAAKGAASLHAPLAVYPTIARSGTLEVGNVAVALMDAISERDYDAREAAASTLTVAGVNPGYKNQAGEVQNNFNDFAYIAAQRAKLLPLPFSVIPTGATADGTPTYEVIVPTVTDSSIGAIPAGVYAGIIESKFREAREIMARELVSAPESSGASKAAGFAEGKSPRLALLAENRETAENTALYFLELRAGATQPRGSVTHPRDHDLAPVLDTIDRGLERLKLSGLRSKTLAVHLIERSLDEDGLMPEDAAQRKQVLAELNASGDEPPTSALERLLGGGGAPARRAPGAAGDDPPTDPTANTGDDA